MDINPWLAEQISLLRERHSDEDIQEVYRHSMDRTWEQHLLMMAMQDALQLSPFNKMLLFEMALPESVKKGLYLTGIDCGADLLQLSIEELRVASRAFRFETEVVELFLAAMGYTLTSCHRRIPKLSALSTLNAKKEFNLETWMLPSPGTLIDFKIDRPSLFPEWFDEFYRKYGHFDNEETGVQVLRNIRPPRLDGVKMPYDYYEFFQAAGNLWDAYEVTCDLAQIEPRITRPKFPDEDVYSIYREGVKTVVDIFERTMLLDKLSKGKYLSGTDEQKLSIAEEGKPESFQLLLISQVELKIDIENIVIYLDECRKGKHREDFLERPAPVNPKIAKMILRLRGIYSDDCLRERYIKALEQNSDLSWEEFIVQTAMAEP